MEQWWTFYNNDSKSASTTHPGSHGRTSEEPQASIVSVKVHVHDSAEKKKTTSWERKPLLSKKKTKKKNHSDDLQDFWETIGCFRTRPTVRHGGLKVFCTWMTWTRNSALYQSTKVHLRVDKKRVLESQSQSSDLNLRWCWLTSMVQKPPSWLNKSSYGKKRNNIPPPRYEGLLSSHHKHSTAAVATRPVLSN